MKSPFSDDLANLNLLLKRIKRERLRVIAAQFTVAAALLFSLQCLLAIALSLYSLYQPFTAWPLQGICLSFSVYLLTIPWIGYQWLKGSFDSDFLALEMDKCNSGFPDLFRTVIRAEKIPHLNLLQWNKYITAFLKGPNQNIRSPQRFNRVTIASALMMGCVFITFGIFCAEFFASGQSKRFLMTLLHPVDRLHDMPQVDFQIQARADVLGMGDTLHIQAKVSGYRAGQEFYAHVLRKNKFSRFPLEMKKGQLSFSLGPLYEDVELYLASQSSQRGRSEVRHFKVKERPVFSSRRLIIQSPAYTRLTNDTLSEAWDDLALLPGSILTWQLESRERVKHFLWSYNDSLGSTFLHTDTLPPKSKSEIVKTFLTGFDYRLEIEDEDGVLSASQSLKRFTVRQDLPPEATILSPSGDTLLNLNQKLPLALLVRDDFGISRLAIEYKVFSSMNDERSSGTVNLNAWLKKSAAGMIQSIWDLDPLGLYPENTVEFRVVAWDNDTVTGPKIGRSEYRRLRLPSVEEVSRELARQESQTQSLLRSAAQRQNNVGKKLQRLENNQKKDELPELSSFDMNRIMVREPRNHLERLSTAMAEQAQDLSQRNNDPKAKQALAKLGEAQKKIQRMGEKLPSGDQAALPSKERHEHLERLMDAQKNLDTELKDLRKNLAEEEKQNPFRKMTMQALSQELEKNREEQKELKNFLDYKEKQAAMQKNLMEKTIEEQSQALRDVQKAVENLQEMVQKQMQNEGLGPELLEKMNEIQKLLQEVMSDSLRELLAKKAEGQNVSLEDLKKGVEDLLANHEKMERNLDDAIAALERMKEMQEAKHLEKEFQKLASQEKKLAEQMENLQTQAETNSSKQLEQEKKELSEKQEKLRQETNSTLEKLSQSKSSELSKLGKTGDAAMHEMAQASKSLESENQSQNSGTKEAASHARAAQQALESMQSQAASMGGAGSMSIDLASLAQYLNQSMNAAELQQLLTRSRGEIEEQGWSAELKSNYAAIQRVARWLKEELQNLAGITPLVGNSVLNSARQFSALADSLASSPFSQSQRQNSLEANQRLSRELLKLYNMAKNMSSGGGGGGGSGSASSQGSQGSQGQNGEGNLSQRLRGVSGKQMAVNQMTRELLQSMMEGRNPGQSGSQSANGQQKGTSDHGKNTSGEGQASQSANSQASLAEQLENMAESANEQGGAASKLRRLADEARELESELRSERPRADLTKKQERFNSRLLEAASALEERGFSEERQSERGISSQLPKLGSPMQGKPEIVELLRKARKRAEANGLSGEQKKRVESFFQEMLAK